MREIRFTAPTATTGQRLDNALRLFFPELGLRGIRRLWERGEVLVNGRGRPRGYSVAEGDEIYVRLPEAPPAPLPATVEARVLSAQGEWIFLYKPLGLHSVALAGSLEPSLEGLLPVLFPGLEPYPRLVNRLDQGTSGIVAAACTPEAAERWRVLEDAGLCEKCYLAVLEGRLTETLTVTHALDTARRATTALLPGISTDALRHTRLEPLAALERAQAARLFPQNEMGGEYTLAGCTIHKGARHQIRVHAACAGYPLAGDVRYGAIFEGAFLLHHGALRVAGAHVHCLPPWLGMLPESVRALAAVWLGAQ